MSHEHLFLVVATAFLSSVLTGIGLVIVFKFFIKKYLDEQMVTFSKIFENELKKNVESAGDSLIIQFQQNAHRSFEESAETIVPIFRAELKAAFTEAAEELLPEFRQEVKQGFEEAAEDLLPEFRRQMQESFKEAILATAGGEFVDKAAKTVLRTGSSLVETGLYILRGSRYDD